MLLLFVSFFRFWFCRALHVRRNLKREGSWEVTSLQFKSQMANLLQSFLPPDYLVRLRLALNLKTGCHCYMVIFCNLNQTVLRILFFYCLIWFNSTCRLSQSLWEDLSYWICSFFFFFWMTHLLHIIRDLKSIVQFTKFPFFFFWGTVICLYSVCKSLIYRSKKLYYKLSSMFARVGVVSDYLIDEKIRINF